MNELLVATNTKQVLLNSGPGSWIIEKGNKENGWLGEVPLAEMFRGEDLVSDLRLEDVSATTPASLKWMKTVIDGRILFWPSVPFNVNPIMTYKYLFENGLIYGRESGYPVLTGAVDSGQIRIVKKKDLEGRTWYFKVQLFEGLENELNQINDPTLTNSQYLRTIGHFHNIGVYPVESLWAVYSFPNTLIALQATRENGQRLLAARMYVDSSANAISWMGPTATTATGWLPVLELINPDSYLLPPEEMAVYGYPFQQIAPKIQSGSTEEDRLIPADLIFGDSFVIATAVKPTMDSIPTFAGDLVFLQNTIGSAVTITNVEQQ